MNDTKKLLIGAAVVSITAGAAYLLLRPHKKPSAQELYAASVKKILEPCDNGKVLTSKDVQPPCKDDLKGAGPKYIIVHGRVFDVEHYMSNHPGGADMLRDQIGRDATEEFDVIMHSPEALEEMVGLYVGMYNPLK